MTTLLDGTAVVGWLATFAVHSTLALGLAWSLSLVLRGRALALQESVLRVSLWGSLASTTVQCTALGNPWSAELVLPRAAAAPGVATPALQLPDASAADVASATAFLDRLPWSTVAIGAAGALALLGLLSLLFVQRRLARVLADRQPETDPRILATAADVARELGLRQSPHVSRSERIATPIAIGWLRPEVCLPRRAGELRDASLRAMLAHEVAHLRRADPAWMWLAAWLQALFPWQPLFLLARRRWARLVELRCDAIAAQHATPVAVAGCLLDVADWLRPAPALAITFGMVARPSALRERVESVLRGGSSLSSRRSSLASSGAVLAALTFGAPGLVTAGPAAPDDSVAAAPAAAPAPASAGAPALAARVAVMQEEHDAPVADAARLRRLLRAVSPSPELAQLEANLTHRLSDLARLRARLQPLLARKITETRQ